jgi:3D (Asp-Asp-Asp) domain-containing protein
MTNYFYSVILVVVGLVLPQTGKAAIASMTFPAKGSDTTVSAAPEPKKTTEKASEKTEKTVKVETKTSTGTETVVNVKAGNSKTAAASETIVRTTAVAKPTTTPAVKTAVTAAVQHPASEDRRVNSSPITGDRIVAYPSPSTTAPRTSITNPAVSRSDVPGVPSSYHHAEADDNSDDSAPVRGKGRLARLTAYWSSEGDYYTGRGISSTGVRLHDGHCAVDPNIIPYGSIVEIPGMGRYLAVDTGSAVIDRTAAREAGHNSAERGAIVIDLFFESAREAEQFESGAARFATITWWTPTSATLARARSLFADENWTKIQSKQL